MSRTAVIILHFGKIENTKNCLQKLKQKLGSHLVILINNDKGDISELKNIIPNTTLIQNKQNLGFATGANQGITTAFKNQDIDSVFLMNNDLILSFGTIDMLRKTLFNNEKNGIVSPVLHSDNKYDWGGTLNKYTGNVKHKNWENKPKTMMDVGHIAGATMLISRKLIEKIGQLDTRFFLYFEDLDFCMRTVAAGYKILIDPQIIADHEISASSHPWKRTYYQWQSHLKFTFKYMPLQVYPTAILYNIIFYPLVLIKIKLFK